MKHMLVLLMAAMLVFSFAGCTQYDFSALEDFWQNQNEETEKAQETDILPSSRTEKNKTT